MFVSHYKRSFVSTIGRNNLFKSGLNKLVEWISSKNWDVRFGVFEDEMSQWDKVIKINIKCKLENQLYTLLHECGHLLLYKNKNYKKQYPYSFKVDMKLNRNKRLMKVHRYQVDLISEEIDAWRKGKELAKRLRIYINEDNYNNEMAKYVFTYINGAC